MLRPRGANIYGGMEVPAATPWLSPHGRRLPDYRQRTLVMGILNVTPDSFSDGGQLADNDAVVTRAAQMIDDGVDVLDVGGESTRPGASPVPEAEERARVVPAIRAIRARWPEIPLSIDTFKPEVALAAIEAGADVVNDVWGFTRTLSAAERRRALTALASDPAAGCPAWLASPMAEAVRRLNCPVIAMHNRPDRDYRDFWTDLIADLRLACALARQAGIAPSQLWLDPGFGFAKSPGQNLEVIKHLDRIVALGFPVMVGTSRKSTLGRVLGTDLDQRLEATAATMVWAIERGCRMIRVHDVGPMVRLARMTDAIKAGADFPFGA